MGAYEVVTIGASWGALNALRIVLGKLPESFAPAVIVVPHRSKDHEQLLPGLLGESCKLPVKEVDDKDQLRGGHVFLAPSDYHLMLDPSGHFSLSVDEPVRFSRPSIDVTFESVADAFADRAVGIVLTGANEDGSRGLKRIFARGGHAIVQDPATAEVDIMPAAALVAVPDAVVLPLERIADYLTTLVTREPQIGATR